MVLAVYNTMPYLVECLRSLEAQSIGHDRMEIIAVDDGSTDGSGAELDQFAARRPVLVTVLRQPNSGGPAGPSNRALDNANGRYVFFIGADDYLGPQALERMVDAADRTGADVVLGKVVGVNGRYIDQRIFAANQDDVDLLHSPLPWSLANTKLFRRQLIEDRKLRFATDMPMLSDQPFTIEALVNAGRIAVVADYDCYFAVRRMDRSNISFRPRRLTSRIACIERLVDFVGELIEPGPRRDAILLRHFNWEISLLLRRPFLLAPRDEQERVYAGVRRLADAYLTDRIRRRLFVPERLRIEYAQRATLDELLALLRSQDESPDPPLVVEAGRSFVTYPGFRDARWGLPDTSFELTPGTEADWLARMQTTAVRWRGGRVVEIEAVASVADLPGQVNGPPRLLVGDVPAPAVVVTQEGDLTRVRASIPLRRLLAGQARLGAVRVVRAEVDTAGGTGVADLRAPRKLVVRRRIAFQGLRLFLVTLTANHRDRLIVAVAPVTLGRVVRRLRSVTRGGR
ncbi:hypothetical protein GCM10010201_15200 [Pilimelia columellifera subsp. columellifera]|uniref:Glycosyltransferase n=1 Tax=Pilimelia columellifera subsp. columellifera TaxID=706583 RepID=A0ABP6ANS3_9ACTN